MKERKEGRGNVFVCSKKRREVDNLNQARFLINKKGRSRGRMKTFTVTNRVETVSSLRACQIPAIIAFVCISETDTIKRLPTIIHTYIYTLSTTIRVRQLQVTRTNERSSITRLDLRGELNAKNDRSIHQLSANERTVFV